MEKIKTQRAGNVQIGRGARWTTEPCALFKWERKNRGQLQWESPTDSFRANHQISPHWSASLFSEISSNMLYALPASTRWLERTHAPCLCEETALPEVDGGCRRKHAVREGRWPAGRKYHGGRLLLSSQHRRAARTDTRATQQIFSF